MYSRLHTPNSPLLPLTPIIRNGDIKTPASNMFLTPLYLQRSHARRSFTPNSFNMMPPPSVSPIRGLQMSSGKHKTLEISPKNNAYVTPEENLECSLVLSSAKTSMKRLRSSARLVLLLFFLAEISR